MSFPFPDNMPTLNLRVPSNLENGGVELNDGLLRHWISILPKNDLTSFIQLYMDALKRFNQNETEEQQRLALLDIYREPLNKLLFSLTAAKLAKLFPDLVDQNRIIDDLAELMSELAIGYKIIIVKADKKSNNLKLNTVALLAINRACEQLNYMALHAYKFYRALPARTLNELHQLYQLTLTADLEEKPPFVNKKLQSDFSFKECYCQLLLVTISNPYGLNSDEVLNAYHMMAQLTSIVEISPLPMGAKVVAGQFYINCLSDHPPMPSVLPTIAEQAQPPALILNTKPSLIVVDSLFQQAKNTGKSSGIIDIALLKQLIPYLNTSYERKQIRVRVTGNQKAYLAIGLVSVHQCLSNATNSYDDAFPLLNQSWTILNKNSAGYLVERRGVLEEQSIVIGGLLSIFEASETGRKPLIKIAFIQWMRTDQQGNTKLGLDIIEGEPIAVHYSLQNKDKSEPAILMPEISRINSPASLITRVGIFKQGNILRVRPKNKRFQFNIMLNLMVDKSDGFERFTFNDEL